MIMHTGCIVHCDQRRQKTRLASPAHRPVDHAPSSPPAKVRERKLFGALMDSLAQESSEGILDFHIDASQSKLVASTAETPPESSTRSVRKKGRPAHPKPRHPLELSALAPNTLKPPSLSSNNMQQNNSSSSMKRGLNIDKQDSQSLGTKFARTQTPNNAFSGSPSPQYLQQLGQPAQPVVYGKPLELVVRPDLTQMISTVTYLSPSTSIPISSSALFPDRKPPCIYSFAFWIYPVAS